MTRTMERRSSVMEYEQSVIFGQYHEKLASFARLQSRKISKDKYKEDVIGNYSKKGTFGRFTLNLISYFGNWPLLFFLGIIISFLSFAVDVTHNWLIMSKSDEV